jgi:hypothetical protein
MGTWGRLSSQEPASSTVLLHLHSTTWSPQKPPEHEHFSEHEHFAGILHIPSHSSLVYVSFSQCLSHPCFLLELRHTSRAEELWAYSLAAHCSEGAHLHSTQDSEPEGRDAFLNAEKEQTRQFPTHLMCPLPRNTAESRLTLSSYVSCHLTFCRMNDPLQGCPPFSPALLRYSQQIKIGGV